MIESSWQAWLHPRRALEQLEELRFDNAMLRHDLENAGQRATELTAALDESRKVQHDLEQLHHDLEAEIIELKRVNAEQEARLAEWEAAGAEMERVASQLEKMVGMRDRMNAMRKDYEERIEKLERQLWSARRGGLQYAKPQERELPDPEESELIEPGESAFTRPAPINMAPPRPKLPRDTDDTDWLLSLPPDL